MFLAEITAHLENAGPFYPCPIRLVNSAEILSVIPRNPPRLRQRCLNSERARFPRKRQPHHFGLKSKTRSS